MTDNDYSSMYALVKNNEVVNVIIFEGEQPSFIEALKLAHDIDEIIPGAGQDIMPGIGQIYNPETKKLSIPPAPVTEENPVVSVE